MHRKRPHQHGFTLVELLVTLAIVAIVAAVAMPSMKSVLGNSEISSTSNQLVYAPQSARSEAIKRITPVGLCPSADPLAASPTCGAGYANGWFVFIDLDGDGERGDTEDVILRQEALPPAFSVMPDDLFSSLVLFSISGTSVNSVGIPVTGQIAVSYDGVPEKRNVRVAANGRISTVISVKATAGDSSADVVQAESDSSP